MDSEDLGKKQGFVCPQCRLVFAALGEQVGTSVCCPACDLTLHVPTRADGITPVSIISQSQRSADYGIGQAPSRSDQRPRVEWEREDDQPIQIEQAKGLPWQMIIPAGLIGVILIISMLQLLSNDTPKEIVPREITRQDTRNANPQQSSLRYDALNDSKRLEETLNGFLDAPSVIKRLEFVREVPAIEQKMERYYRATEFKPRSVRSLIDSYAAIGYDRHVVFSAELSDFSRKNGLVIMQDDGSFLIDWESFVGYCEIPWDKIQERQQTTPFVVRAIRKKYEYYNLGFSHDDWQAFELTYPGSTKVLIGYVKRDSPLVSRLLPIGQSSDLMEVTLTLRYPDNPQSKNQVIIEEMLSSNWVQDYDESQ